MLLGCYVVISANLRNLPDCRSPPNGRTLLVTTRRYAIPKWKGHATDRCACDRSQHAVPRRRTILFAHVRGWPLRGPNRLHRLGNRESDLASPRLGLDGH